MDESGSVDGWNRSGSGGGHNSATAALRVREVGPREGRCRSRPGDPCLSGVPEPPPVG